MLFQQQPGPPRHRHREGGDGVLLLILLLPLTFREAQAMSLQSLPGLILLQTFTIFTKSEYMC